MSDHPNELMRLLAIKKAQLRQIEKLETAEIQLFEQQLLINGLKKSLDTQIADNSFLKSVISSASSPAVGTKELLTSDAVKLFLSPESINRRKDKPATVRKDRDSLNLFCEMLGADKPVSELDQADAASFASRIPSYKRTTPRAENTINNYLHSISKFSEWLTVHHSGSGHRKFDISKLRYKRKTKPSDGRLAFSIMDVYNVLTSPKMLGFKHNDTVKYWLPHIAAYSGMRLEEITQLNPQTDIRMHEDVWVFDLNEKDEKTLKTASSARLVPIHNQLIELGLLDYVKTQVAGSHTTLFPTEVIRDGRTGKNAGKRVNRFIAGILKSEGKTLHSFRHTVATILKHHHVAENVAGEILGHSGGRITYSRYGKGYPVSELREAINLIDYRVEK